MQEMESFRGARNFRNLAIDDINKILKELSVYSCPTVLEELGRNGTLFIPDVYFILTFEAMYNLHLGISKIM